VFFLFWSSQAAGSEWVEREWRLALESKGLGFIDPVPLEDPATAPPPSELRSLHFNDCYVTYIRGARAIAATPRPPLEDRPPETPSN
jgi:hypothetical protein